MEEIGIEIIFIVEKQNYASRYSAAVPAIGDEVRFRDKVYKVTNRVWLYNIDPSRVFVYIEEIK